MRDTKRKSTQSHIQTHAMTRTQQRGSACQTGGLNAIISRASRRRCSSQPGLAWISAPEPVQSDPCNPSPCGSNAQCQDGTCTCLPEYQGDPYAGCRPECVLSTDCPRNRACIRNKCSDPCPGTCGQGATCDVVNHIPMCSCPQGMSGNPFVQCRPVPRT